MRCVGRVCAAIVLAAACSVVRFCPPACAQADDEPARFVLFSGRDLWRNGVFAHGGLIWAQNGFDDDGVLLKLLLSGGAYRYNAGGLGGAEVIGAEWTVQALPGWRIKRGDAEFKVFFGPEVQHHYLWPDDPGNRLRGRSLGLRFAGEWWWEPTPRTLFAGDVSVSSIVTSHAGRAAFGWRMLGEIVQDGIYVGPEVQYFGSDGYRQFRTGIHVTSMRTDDVEWTAAVGIADDSDHRTGPYVRLGVLRRR